ncbi:two-component system regulatory protein YycI [Bacillus sp. Cr_A10]|uniref:two-component system regulatory protein YycI n=1 Tax=Bacillus sp. Cr_A10 TaxID=3033993 RepID=UPI0023DB30CE|nr:two-component system regulatory protein YycI [Bacillus sp. Cr_A10]MDF2067485.1 two-component system regulatory protein YycI [Bacillus sp. Cr_A10]
MDWNKTKTIFIIVFSILNVFLFSLYLNRYNEALDLEVASDAPIEDRLFQDNITVSKMDIDIKEASYVSGNTHNFILEELEKLPNQTFAIDGTKLTSTFNKAIPITEENTVEKIVHENVLHGDSYALWKTDEENQSATFFQKVNNRFVYYNKNATLVVYWNDQQELVRYEQTILDNLKDYKEDKVLMGSMLAIKVLYDHGHLKPDSVVKDIKLGYSQLIELTETQVFLPTWHIVVELADGTKEDYFVNAIEGRIVEIQKDPEQADGK